MVFLLLVGQEMVSCIHLKSLSFYGTIQSHTADLSNKIRAYFAGFIGRQGYFCTTEDHLKHSWEQFFHQSKCDQGILWFFFLSYQIWQFCAVSIIEISREFTVSAFDPLILIWQLTQAPLGAHISLSFMTKQEGDQAVWSTVWSPPPFTLSLEGVSPPHLLYVIIKDRVN